MFSRTIGASENEEKNSFILFHFIFFGEMCGNISLAQHKCTIYIHTVRYDDDDFDTILFLLLAMLFVLYVKCIDRIDGWMDGIYL